MKPEQFERIFPFIREWIAVLLADSASTAKPVASLNFSRLPTYYCNDLLTRAKVVFVEKCPVPPLSSIGLTQFSDFENMSLDGITYLDTYFIRRREAQRESLHFHELVHVIQWQLLGPERFLALYADGLAKHGYSNSPLEVMVYDHQARFDSNAPVYPVEATVRQQLEGF